VVIPARNKEGCIRSTVEHLDLELRLKRFWQSGDHGDQMKGDAAVIMMADESDDCRDVALLAGLKRGL
jgi:dolichol-phosphate mannosyltransferase